MEWTWLMEEIVRAFEGAGVLILVVGSLYVGTDSLVSLVRGRADYERTRRRLGRTLLLGLELLVAADVIQTVAVEASLESVTVLGILVVVRTVLSISLDAEIDGVAPWRRAELEASLRRSEPP